MTTPKLRPLAEADLIERTRYYRREAGETVAPRFFDAAVAALRTVERLRAPGRTRVGELSGISGLRAMRIAGFPCGWFYLVPRPDDAGSTSSGSWRTRSTCRDPLRGLDPE